MQHVSLIQDKVRECGVCTFEFANAPAQKTNANLFIILLVLCHAVDVAYLGLGGKQDGGYT